MSKISPFTELLGIRTKTVGKEYWLKVEKEHTNALGIAHGGTLFTLADHAFGQAVNNGGKAAVAMEMKINYLSPVKIGDVLTAQAHIIRKGRNTAVGLVTIKVKNKLKAIVLGTAFFVKNQTQ